MRSSPWGRRLEEQPLTDPFRSSWSQDATVRAVSEPGGSTGPARLLLFYTAGSNELFIVLMKTEVEAVAHTHAHTEDSVLRWSRPRPWELDQTTLHSIPLFSTLPPLNCLSVSLLFILLILFSCLSLNKGSEALTSCSTLLASLLSKDTCRRRILMSAFTDLCYLSSVMRWLHPP